VTQLINGALSDDHELFREIYEALMNGYGGNRADEYYILQDFEAYAAAQNDVSALYKNKEKWARSAIINVAQSGKFSSDRTIQQYADEIWNLKKLSILNADIRL